MRLSVATLANRVTFRKGLPTFRRNGLLVHFLKRCIHIANQAYEGFLRDDGWAIASHIALSALMSLFPFLIFITALTGFLGSQQLADQVAKLLLDAWPKQVAGPIAAQIESVLTNQHGSLLTLGVALAIYFSSSGVESLRIGLNSAYDVTERRPWWLLRLESIGYVLVGAAALIALAFVIAGATGALGGIARSAEWLAPVEISFTLWRYLIATAVIVGALVMVHKWLPA